jgi:type I restriction enzyme S subunit
MANSANSQQVRRRQETSQVWPVSTVGQACTIRNDLRLPLSEEVRAGITGPYPYYGPTGVLDHINEFRLDGRFALIGEDGDHFLKFRERPMTLFVTGQFNVNNHAHVIAD